MHVLGSCGHGRTALLGAEVCEGAIQHVHLVEEVHCSHCEPLVHILAFRESNGGAEVARAQSSRRRPCTPSAFDTLSYLLLFFGTLSLSVSSLFSTFDTLSCLLCDTLAPLLLHLFCLFTLFLFFFPLTCIGVGALGVLRALLKHARTASQLLQRQLQRTQCFRCVFC